MKVNEDKRNIVLSGYEDMHVKIGILHIKNSRSEKLLRVKIDSDLNVEEPISSICKNDSAKLNAHARMPLYINERKR